MKVRATQVGYYGMERHYPRGDKSNRAGHAFEIQDHEFSESWMEPIGISVDEALKRCKAAREALKAAPKKKAAEPKAQKKTAAQRAQLGEPVAVSELNADDVLPVPESVDEEVI